MDLKYLFHSGKNNKLLYYLKGHLKYAIPNSIYRRSLESELRTFDTLTPPEQRYVTERVEYYCKLDKESVTALSDAALRIGDHTLKNHTEFGTPYFLDTFEHTRYFAPDLRWERVYGDVTHVPAYPSIVKSRPLGEDNRNSVLLHLNKIRHFVTLNDSVAFEKKMDRAIFRGDVRDKPQRRRFLELYYDHPMCDLGVVSRREVSPAEWQRPALSLYNHLRYKFVMALEGNDVATNLKWVMSTNSLAVMPRPTCETWFMEGLLRGGEHYVEIAADFSDLESQLHYYIDHPMESKEMATNANRYVEQFKDRGRERLISLLVLRRYFERTGQL